MESRKHPLWATWSGMKQRCRQHPGYAGRVSVHAEWLAYGTGFKSFASYIEETLGPRPEGMSLDRIDNDGNYEPGNLRWATRSQQASNQKKRQTGYTRGNPANKYRWVKRKGGKWAGAFKFEGKDYYAGAVDTQLEAHQAASRLREEIVNAVLSFQPSWPFSC